MTSPWRGNGATIAIYANNGGDTFPVDIRPTFALNLRYQFLLLYTLDPALLATATEDVTAASPPERCASGRRPAFRCIITRWTPPRPHTTRSSGERSARC